MVSELSVLFRRRRTWAMLLALAAIPSSSQSPCGSPPGHRPGEGRRSSTGSRRTDFSSRLTALVVSVPLFLPLTVGVVAGDTIAGEASHGTLRYLLVAPAGRSRLLAVKYVSSAVFCVSATLTVVVAGT